MNHVPYRAYRRISKNNREEVLEKAHKDLAAVMDQYIARLVKELRGSDFWKLRRAYSPGVCDSFSVCFKGLNRLLQLPNLTL